MRSLVSVITIAASASLAMAASAQDAPTAAPASAATASPSAAATDAAGYVAEAGRSDMYEIQSSKLAQNQAQSPAVKAFAKQMVQDHTTSTQKVMKAAGDAGMPKTPPPALDPRRQSMLDQLKSASGPQFDQLYVQQQKAAHQEALALHQGYAQGGDKAPLRAAAQQITPVVQHHLTMLQDM
jgi:putative membrane protein